MTRSTKFTKVSELGQLEDKNLVPELKKRFKHDRLNFVTTEECRKQIDALSLTENNKKLAPDIVSTLWQQLVEDAVTYLKMSDPREWAEEYGKPSSPVERRSL